MQLENDVIDATYNTLKQRLDSVCIRIQYMRIKSF